MAKVMYACLINQYEVIQAMSPVEGVYEKNMLRALRVEALSSTIGIIEDDKLVKIFTEQAGKLMFS